MLLLVITMQSRIVAQGLFCGIAKPLIDQLASLSALIDRFSFFGVGGCVGVCVVVFGWTAPTPSDFCFPSHLFRFPCPHKHISSRLARYRFLE